MTTPLLTGPEDSLRAACVAASRAIAALVALGRPTPERLGAWLARVDRVLVISRAALAELDAADPARLARAGIPAEAVAAHHADVARIEAAVEAILAMQVAARAADRRGDAALAHG